MGQDKYYGNLIWTNHALSRVTDRGITQQMVWETIRNPESSGPDRDGAVRYRQRQGTYTITAVVKENERREQVVLSCWIDPPLPGTSDARKKKAYQNYQQASPLKKILLTILKQLGF